MNRSTTTANLATNPALLPPRFQPIQLGFGLFLLAIGSSAFISNLVGSPWPIILSAVIVAEGLLLLWLVRRNQQLLRTVFVANQQADDGPDPSLVAAALAELDADEPMGFSTIPPEGTIPPIGTVGPDVGESPNDH